MKGKTAPGREKGKQDIVVNTSRRKFAATKNLISYNSFVKSQIMSSFKVWVKALANVEEDAFEVDCQAGMNFDSLKKGIAAELSLPRASVKKVYPSCDEKAIAYAPGILVEKPKGGAIGASHDSPYYYSLGIWCYICSIICYYCFIFVFNSNAVLYVLTMLYHLFCRCCS